MRELLGIVALLCVCPVFGDVVTLKNGDRVTGSVVKKDAKSITIKTKAFGDITAPWDEVDSVTTDTPVTVELQTGATVTGTLSTTGDRVVVKTETESKEAARSEVTAIRNAEEQAAYERLIAPPWSRLWAGAANFGLAGTQGNAETLTLTVGVNAARETRHDKTSVRFNAIRASALVNNVSATTADAVRGGWGYERNLLPRVFVNVFNDYEFDRFQNLDLRVVLGGGAGFIAWKHERSRLDFSAGGAWNRESFGATPQSAAFTRNAGEIYFGNEFTLKVNATTSVFQNARIFANMSDPGVYRLNFDIGSSTKLMKWLQWNTSVSDRFLSNPVFGRQRNDFLYSTGLGITFAR